MCGSMIHLVKGDTLHLLLCQTSTNVLIIVPTGGLDEPGLFYQACAHAVLVCHVAYVGARESIVILMERPVSRVSRHTIKQVENAIHQRMQQMEEVRVTRQTPDVVVCQMSHLLSTLTNSSTKSHLDTGRV